MSDILEEGGQGSPWQRLTLIFTSIRHGELFMYQRATEDKAHCFMKLKHKYRRMNATNKSTLMDSVINSVDIKTGEGIFIAKEEMVVRVKVDMEITAIGNVKI